MNEIPCTHPALLAGPDGVLRCLTCGIAVAPLSSAGATSPGASSGCQPGAAADPLRVGDGAYTEIKPEKPKKADKAEKTEKTEEPKKTGKTDEQTA